MITNLFHGCTWNKNGKTQCTKITLYHPCQMFLLLSDHDRLSRRSNWKRQFDTSINIISYWKFHFISCTKQNFQFLSLLSKVPVSKKNLLEISFCIQHETWHSYFIFAVQSTSWPEIITCINLPVMTKRSGVSWYLMTKILT